MHGVITEGLRPFEDLNGPCGHLPDLASCGDHAFGPERGNCKQDATSQHSRQHPKKHMPSSHSSHQTIALWRISSTHRRLMKTNNG